MVTFELNFEEFNNAMTRMTEDGKRNIRDVIWQQSGLLALDLAKFTPPTGSAPVSESWNDQKKAGENAISKDLQMAFSDSMEDLEIVKNNINKKTGLKLREYIRTKNVSKMQKTLDRMKIRKRVISEPTNYIHRSVRDNRGRVYERRHGHYFVMERGSVKRFYKDVIKRVGRAKAGWVVAARALGRNLPGWITRHAAEPGVCNVALSGEEPSITMENLNTYANGIERRQNAAKSIIQRAINRRADSMNHQTDSAIGKAFEGYKR